MNYFMEHLIPNYEVSEVVGRHRILGKTVITLLSGVSNALVMGEQKVT